MADADISDLPAPPDISDLPAPAAPAASSAAPSSNITDPSLGTLDALQHYIRSAVAPLGGGLTYLGTLGATGDPAAAAAVKQQTESTIAGQPATKSGAAIVNTVNAAAAPAIKKFQDSLQAFADKAYETGIPVPGLGFVGAHTALAGAYGATLPQALQAVATGGRAAEAAGEWPKVPEPAVPPVEGAPQAAVAPPAAKPAGPVTGADLLAEPDPLGLHEHAAITSVTPPGTQGGPTAGLGSTPAGASQRGGPKFEAPNPADPAEAMYEDQVRRDMAAAAANPNAPRPPLRQGTEDPAQPLFDAQVRSDVANSTPLNQTPLGSTPAGASQRGGPKFTPTQGTGVDTTGQPVQYAAPKDEGVQSGPRPAADQAQRLATLGALDQLSGGALPETRTSAVTGDTKESGTDWAHAKVNDPAGNRMTGVIASEQNALRTASSNIQRSTGDPQEGVDRDALLGRGTQLNNLFSAVQDHFDKGAAALYKDSNGQASTVPLSNINRVKTVLSDPANFPGVEGKALHEDLISRGQQLGFLPKTATGQPQDALSARMQSAGLTPPSNTGTPTVQHGEQWRQFTGDLWSSKTARTIQKFRDAMDEDAGSASGKDLYTAARAMNTQRRTIFEPDVMQKLAAPKDRAGVEGLDVADIPDHIAEQGEGQFNHVVNVIKSAAHLKSTEHDFPTLAANAMNALRGHMAARLHDAGVSKVQGAWDPKSYYNKVNADSLKLPMIFKPKEIENIRTVNRAGNVLKMDKTYKGAEVEAQNIGIVGKGRAALGKAAHGAVDAAAHGLFGPFGAPVAEMSGLAHGAERFVGGNPEKAFEKQRLKEVNSRIQKVGTSAQVPPPAAPTPKARGPKQRGGPAMAKITGHDDEARRSLERMAGFERKGGTPPAATSTSGPVAGFHGSQRSGLTAFNDPDQAGSGIGVAARGAGLYIAGDEPGAKIYAGKNGSTYKVSAPGINHEDLLHWDKPAAANPKAAKVFAAHGVSGKNLTGGDAYEQLSEKLVPPPPGRPAKGEGHAAASKLLNAHGVPGISYDASGKYSQGGSTARNAVIFDPSKVKIEGAQTLGQQIGGAKQRGGPKFTPPKEDEGSLTFRHFSPNLTADKVTLDPKYNGTGIKGAEWKRQMNEKSPKVISAYAADHPTNQVEPGLRGTTEYSVSVPKSKMYDLSADPKGYLKSGPGAFTKAEKKIQSAGYTGYHLPEADGIHKGQARFFKPVEGNRVGAETAAPSGTPGATVNVGLHVGDPANGGRVMHPDEAVSAIKAAGGNVGKTSVVQSGTEPTLVADLDKPFAKKDLHDLSAKLGQDAIAQRNADGTGTLAGPKAKDWGEYNPDFFREHSGKTATEEHPLMGNLTADERDQLRTDTTKRMIDAFHALPDTHEYAAAALAGQAKKGWYKASAQAITNVFGVDAPRFAALLAAMSPQTSVQMNFHNALRSFVNWDKAGRPTDPKQITDIMRGSVLRQENGAGLLHAWVPNSIRALTDAEPEKTVLSGPKVNSFNQNLRNNVNEVTNDAWMANFGKVDPRKMGGGINKAGTQPGKSPTYLAMSAKVRAAAGMLSKLTGETWTPAEVQETVWSWSKTAFEHAEKSSDKKTIPELVKNGDITDDLIKSTPDFHQLFSSPEHAGFLSGSRFKEDAARVPGSQGAGAEPATSGKALAAAHQALKGPLREHLAEAARRLESIRQGRKVTADDEDVPF